MKLKLKFNKTASLLFCLLFFQIYVHSQNLLSKSFDIRTETSRPKFTKLFRDHDGLIWAGTDKGIFTFDGINFIKISGSDSSNTGAVTAIYETPDHVKWIGYELGKIARVAYRKFELYSPQEGLPKAAVSGFAMDKNGVMYFSTRGEGVYCIENKRIYNIDHDDHLSDDYCYSILLLPDGRICVSTDEGINFITFKNGNKHVTSFGNSEGLPDDIVRVVQLDENNKLWLGFQEKGICSFDYNSNKIIDRYENASSGQVNHILPVGDELWINFEEGGVRKFDRSGHSEKVLLDNDKYQKVTDIISDLENNVWLAESIHLIRTSGNKISIISSIANKKLEYIHCILSDQKGGIWFSPDNQLQHLSVDENGVSKTEYYTIQKGERPADIVTLYEDKYGFIWLGTLGDGVFRFNPKTGNSRSFTQKGNLEESSILNITGLGDKIWIGGFNGVNVYTIKANGEQENAVIEKDTALSKLSHDYVYDIFIDSKERIWFGTDENGVYVLDKGNLVNYSLNASSVHSFTEDTKGRIWFSIQDAGLGYYDANQIKFYSSKDGLSDPSASSIKIMKNGKIVIVHSNGFDILDPIKLKIIYHSSEENLSDINSDLNSITESPDSAIWIGTERGIIRYKPMADLNISEPKISFQGLRLNLNGDFTTKTKLDYDENNLRFDINGLWYSDPQRVNYSFILEGYSTVWENTKDHTIIFSKLPAGKYTLKVKASLNNNFTDSPVLLYAFEIAPPIWQRWWVKILLAFLIAITILFIVRRRERRLRGLDLLQKEKIEFQFETLKNQVNPHFLFNSFNTLINIIETDSKLAVEYVEKLSDFFRNIVNYRDKNTISIEEEISLLKNYIFIQKKRYGNNLEIDFNVDPEVSTYYYIPPLTLQLLAENAIKHNAISKETPLMIKVYSGGNRSLIVENNINRKLTKDNSSGMGLQNIIGRYKLLTTEKIGIEENRDTFIVTLPLLQKVKQ